MVIVHIFCMFTRGYIYGISMITKSWVNVDDFAVAYHGIWFPSITNQSLNEISDKKNQMCLEFPPKKIHDVSQQIPEVMFLSIVVSILSVYWLMGLLANPLVLICAPRTGAQAHACTTRGQGAEGMIQPIIYIYTWYIIIYYKWYIWCILYIYMYNGMYKWHYNQSMGIYLGQLGI